ncbi:MAG: type VI secretion system ImpA family N-terminal domain-containing protein [Sphingomonas fennica]
MALTVEQCAEVVAPIAGGPGIDGREDEGAAGDLFRELRFQRKSVFRAEQKAAMGEEVGGDDTWTWEMLLETARDYLIEHSKDLEPAAILLEALTREDGLPGLVQGTTLIADLVTEWWDEGLYPPEDEEDGVEARFQPLSGLSGGGSDKEGTLVGPLRRMLIAGSGATGELRYMDRVVADAQFATAQNAQPGQRETLNAEAQNALNEMEATARRIPRGQLTRAQEQLKAAEAEWRRAIGFISERTKPRFPAASKVSDELRSIREWLDGLVRLLPEDAGPEPEAGDEGAGGGEDAGAGGSVGGPFTIGQIARREDALRAVSAAATFFERNEPLSPIGSALRDIDRRARMSFTDLLKELIPDSDTRETYYWRSGIKPPVDVDADD